MMDIHGVKGDIYQTGVVMRYEFLKHIRGKRLLIFALATLACFLFLTLVPYAFGQELSSDPKTLVSSYFTDMLFLLILVGTTLIASTAIVSEFEDRTALLMFTRPVRKETIFFGKFIVSFLITAVMVGIYYVGVAVVSLIVAGGVPVEILSSFGLAMLFIFTVTGVAFLVSALMKRGSTTTVIVFMLLLISMIGFFTLSALNVEPWFDLYANFLAISTVITGLTTYRVTQSTDFGDFTFLNFYPEIPTAAILLLIYGLVTTIVALLLFRRREF